mgnify:CR=1 FL=1
MSLKVNYTNAAVVSMSGKPDRIQFVITDESYFEDQDGLTIENGETITQNIPPQLPQNEEL